MASRSAQSHCQMHSHVVSKEDEPTARAPPKRTRYTQTPVNKSAMKVNLQIEQLHRSGRSGLKFVHNLSTLTSSSIRPKSNCTNHGKTVELAKLHAASGPHRLQRKLVSSQGQHCQCTTLVALKIQATEQPALEGVDAPGQNEDTYTNTWNKAPG